MPQGVRISAVLADLCCQSILLLIPMQVGSGDCPHTLFYGPNGAGKKTLILALLREIYGAGADKVYVLSTIQPLQARNTRLEVWSYILVLCSCNR